MDFDSIEGLSDEDLDNLYLATCRCDSPTSNGHVWYNFSHCSLKLSNEYKCYSWCVQHHGFNKTTIDQYKQHFNFDTHCFCGPRGHLHWSYFISGDLWGCVEAFPENAYFRL